MKLCFALNGVSELQSLNKSQRRLLVDLYFRTESQRSISNRMEGVLVGITIFGLIGGMFGGAILTQTSFWGPVLGGSLAIISIAFVFYLLHLRFAVPKFRRFLQAGAGKYILESLKTPKTVPPTPAVDVPRPLNKALFLDYPEKLDALNRLNTLSNDVKTVGYDVARVSEIGELAAASFEESTRLSRALELKNRESVDALKRLQLGRWLRISQKIFEMQTEAACLLRRGAELMADAEAKLETAQTTLSKIK